MLAGPGAISNVILYAGGHEGIEHKLLVMAVVLSTALVVYWVWRLAARYGDRLNPSTLIIANRVMGLLLAAIAVEFILDGVAAHYPNIITID